MGDGPRSCPAADSTGKYGDLGTTKSSLTQAQATSETPWHLTKPISGRRREARRGSRQIPPDRPNPAPRSSPVRHRASGYSGSHGTSAPPAPARRGWKVRAGREDGKRKANEEDRNLRSWRDLGAGLVLGFGRRRGVVSEEEEVAVAVAMDGSRSSRGVLGGRGLWFVSPRLLSAMREEW